MSDTTDPAKGGWRAWLGPRAWAVAIWLLLAVVSFLLLHVVGLAAVLLLFALSLWGGRTGALDEEDAPDAEPRLVTVHEPPPEAYYRRVAADVPCAGLEHHQETARLFMFGYDPRLELRETRDAGRETMQVIGHWTDEEAFRRSGLLGHVPDELARRLLAETADAGLQAALQVIRRPRSRDDTGELRFDIWTWQEGEGDAESP